jgi:glyoxylase-like metal-dependent hydrolase (beta-lactamase superfamily II)
MLREIADGVLVHESEFCQSNTVVVTSKDGALLVDPGVLASDLECLAADLAGLGQAVVAGFSTHPHWDHLLWSTGLGHVPRYATDRCATTVRERLSGAVDRARFGIPDGVSLDLLGMVTGLPAGAVEVPWGGPRVRILEHSAHAPGHAALLVEERRVFIAGDLLSDVLVPMLDLGGALDPVGDYLAALDLIENLADGVEILVPGHGSVCDAAELGARIDRDRRFVHALANGLEPDDPRIGLSTPIGWEWVNDVHAGQRARLASAGLIP